MASDFAAIAGSHPRPSTRLPTPPVPPPPPLPAISRSILSRCSSADDMAMARAVLGVGMGVGCWCWFLSGPLGASRTQFRLVGDANTLRAFAELTRGETPQPPGRGSVACGSGQCSVGRRAEGCGHRPDIASTRVGWYRETLFRYQCGRSVRQWRPTCRWAALRRNAASA
jgi:hypothetical protein